MGASVSSPAAREKQLATLFAMDASRPSDAEAMAKLKKLLPTPDSAVANARQPDDCGSRTVLMVAISLRMGKEVGQYLVDKGADLTVTDSSGYSVLHWASMKDDTHWVTKALEAVLASISSRVARKPHSCLRASINRWRCSSF
jgi:ankyrin repeat protein